MKVNELKCEAFAWAINNAPLCKRLNMWECIGDGKHSFLEAIQVHEQCSKSLSQSIKFLYDKVRR
jgi:hypothetical protein